MFVGMYIFQNILVNTNRERSPGRGGRLGLGHEQRGARSWTTLLGQQRERQGSGGKARSVSGKGCLTLRWTSALSNHGSPHAAPQTGGRKLPAMGLGGRSARQCRETHHPALLPGGRLGLTLPLPRDLSRRPFGIQRWGLTTASHRVRSATGRPQGNRTSNSASGTPWAEISRWAK